MKTLASLLTVVLLSAFGFGQSYTTVTATLQDSSTQVWANATWTTEFSKPSGVNIPFTNHGTNITANQSGAANGSGVFTVVLDDNLVVSPAGSGWKFTICPNATVTSCNTIVLTITGATQDVSTQLNAVLTVPKVNGGPTAARAYSDSEANGSFGSIYVNSITSVAKQCSSLVCSGSGWIALGGPGTGNVSTSGSPLAHQVPIWFDPTHILGITPGTAGWVLTSNGVGADPSFQAAAGGAVTLPFFFGPGILYTPMEATTVSPNVNANQVGCLKFTLTGNITVSKVSAISVLTSGTTSFAIYSVTGNLLIDSGPLPQAVPPIVLVTNTITPVALTAGVYYLAWSTTGSIGSPFTYGISTGNTIFGNTFTGTSLGGVAANSRSGGTMPATLGVITDWTTSNTPPVPTPLFE